MSQENVEIVRAWVAKGVLGVTEAEFNESCDTAAELIALRSGTEGSYRGLAGFLRFQADTATAFEKFQPRYEEFDAVGDRVLCGGSIRVRGAGSGVEMDIPAWNVVEFRDGKISRWESFGSKADARKAVELAEWAMSEENLDLVRAIYAHWERGEFGSADWAHPEIEYVTADGPDPGAWTGLADMAENFRAWLRLWEGFRLTADEYRQFGAASVVVLDHYSGHGKTSGLDIGQIQAKGAWVFHIRDGKIMRMIRYLDRDRALADLGLAE